MAILITTVERIIMSKNIGYHTRLYSDNKVKVSGGSFGGSVDMGTVERLVKSWFTVTVKPSGTAVFVDREGREVCLYISVDARETEAGKAALRDYREAQEKAWEAALERERIEHEQLKIESFLDGLSREEIIKRLSGK